MTTSVEPYRTHSPWSDPGRFAPLLADLPADPAAVARVVSDLLYHPFFAVARNVALPERAADDREVRGVEAMLGRILARDERAITVAREAEDRLFCVCAGYARLATAVLRSHAVPSRCRVGFAAYFVPGHLEDHWVCEYWDGERWRLLDAQLDDRSRAELGITFAPTDVPRDRFLDASTAWQRVRAGEIDPATIGLPGMGLAGTWFVAHSVLRDAAALNKEEMLPWETWSIGRDFGPGRDVPPAHARALDAVAALLAGAPDAELAERVYREQPWLRVTPTVLSFATGAPHEVPARP